MGLEYIEESLEQGYHKIHRQFACCMLLLGPVFGKLLLGIRPNVDIEH